MQPGFDSGLALGPFFHDEITAGKNALGVALSAEAEMYAVQLLVRYATLEIDVALDRPLVLQWAAANDLTDPQKRRQSFLRIGDAALLRNGFLHEPDDTRVSPRYVGSVGKSAYAEVARLSSRAASEAFQLIAETFETLCRIMMEIRLRYARWDVGEMALVGNGSPAVAQRFGEAGLVLLSPTDA